MGMLGDLGSKREKAMPEIRCKFCGQMFTRMRVGHGSGGRKYCYNPDCERRREHEYSKVWRHAAYLKKKRKRKAAAKEAKWRESSARNTACQSTTPREIAPSASKK
jgi:hypothetical protein